MKFEFRPYRRRFRQPLKTHHGVWTVREGILIRLEDAAGQVGFGEIAPLEWFGSESIEDAIALCRNAPSAIDLNWIREIPLPACQFGFESAALMALGSPLNPPRVGDFEGGKVLQHSGLLSQVEDWKTLWNQAYRTFKLKIAIAPIETEITTIASLLSQLPKDTALRLDANMGLNESELRQWLEFCDDYSSIEFIEQPMRENDFEIMLKLSQQYRTQIALDESVATLGQLRDCYDRGWHGIFVIKPAIAGFPSQLRQFCQKHQIDTVFSTVFETAIGRQMGLQLAAELSNRAVGYGTAHWFNELNSENFEELWNSLSVD
ncbi:o-succinylbenzoate synthase [Leptolyngbya sp. FACHB-17]|uniref:o-succinylbenzoate synthase n=1 Tax=unclassified Leptolyngbya TaxID=2650499 RepID=UPI0016819F7E|nr:o-succinylbenzoate synthase [Leptolyngbya sp. FACHB-17]MBD2079774.1 o-succinylbenzoate synthase [Leptolyngbya sp. FACHB-17]